MFVPEVDLGKYTKFPSREMLLGLFTNTQATALEGFSQWVQV